ncbi:ImmA/IrrE family metallo-endopeptidase (plasmid) [Rhodococcus antarcticus]|uniref:ImmA/IrrE family metallo-endopeptidase n=1 Tax=Rhodococcus antarcticus TaxID=2987751 RepID=A0ABY6P5G8_9NOCA|nr:ImmA/IrrE family metallo-endopeptidase [Rhodococcus antarcticus]UZJ26902.1 ImmA/IrrE family metallo-endopeptidase [Rhodococcus antarcticus]
MLTPLDDSLSTPGARLSALLAVSELTAAQLSVGMLLAEAVPVERVLDGTYEPSVSELLGAADVLEVPVAVLTGELPVSGHLGVSLRLGRIRGAEALSGPLAYANRLLDHGALLDSWFGPAAAPLRESLSRVMLSRDKFGKAAGMVTADRVRAVLDLGDDGPITDMVAMVESFGIPVASLPLPAGVHGLNVRDLRTGGAHRVILVSSTDVWAKQRYTLAHELCHALYDDKDQVIVDRAEEPEALPEWRAESFARHLLLPTRSVREAVRRAPAGPRRWQQVTASLMARFGVSRDATVIALQEDGGVPSVELDSVRSARVDDLLAAANLVDQWREFCVAEHAESGSPTLVSRAAQAYGNGWVRADLVADLMRGDIETVERELAAAGWQPSS